jgi:hydroxyacylglutathione hydrolase
MLLERFYDDKLAQASYLVGCPESGEALIIDPARDIAPYLRAAERHDFKIIGCAETHIHADFVSGSRELAHETGATMFVSGHGKGDLKYKFPDGDNLRYVCLEVYLCQCDHVLVGGVRVVVV